MLRPGTAPASVSVSIYVSVSVSYVLEGIALRTVVGAGLHWGEVEFEGPQLPLLLLAPLLARQAARLTALWRVDGGMDGGMSGAWTAA